jgi:hypothetical protein
MAQFQSEQRDKFGAQNLDFVDYISLEDRLGILTANATTPYSMAFPNLAKTGPLVIEVPPGATAGGVADFWQRPLTDTGALGPEKGQGGKFLILGPGDRDMHPEGYYVFRTPTNNFWSGNRALDPDPAKAIALLSQGRIYPFAQRDNPKDVSKQLSVEGRRWAGQQPGGLAYWALLSRLVNEEPAIERDRISLATLVLLGIEKGRPFNPDAHQKRILEEASIVGELMARANSYSKRFEGAVVWPDKHWEFALHLKEVDQEAPNYTQLDERSSWFYEAIGVVPAMMGRTVGAGQLYLGVSKASDGNRLDGGKHYILHVPKDAPTALFWALTVYDNETRCLIDTGTFPEHTSLDDIEKNEDGSVDLRFGPTVPSGKSLQNWIKTLPNKGWFAYFRIYGPTQPYFDRTWQLPDIVEAK